MNQEHLLKEQARLAHHVKTILALSKAKGASQAEVAVSAESGMSVTVRMRELETVEHNENAGFGITVFFDKRKGSASTTDTSPAAIEAAVSAACNIAQYSSEDPCAGLPEPELLAPDFVDLDLYHPWDITPEQATERALACEAIALQKNPLVTNSEGVILTTYQGLRVYGNSHGFLGHFASSRHSLSCSLIAEQAGSMQRDYSYTVARDQHDLRKAELVADAAVERTIRRLNARKLGTRQVPVVFAADLATGLIGSYLKAVSGSNLYRESSFLLNSLGQQVFPEFMEIREDPFVRKGLASCPYDSEGVKVQARDLVKQGCVEGYLLSCYSARKLGMQTTGNAGGAHNIYVKNHNQSLAQLLKTMDTGLLITDVMGQGVNLVTGDYSRGASGFWVEQGEIQFPVEEITIAGTLQNMYRGIIAIGDDVETRGYIHCGSILIDNLTVAGN